ncbi:MAG: hypothetical protein ACT4PX_01655 [Actinomycetota bacterium]
MEHDDLPRSLRDAAYIAVGFGVIGFQRAQVARRELARQLPDLAEHLPAGVREALEVVGAALRGPPPPRAGA